MKFMLLLTACVLASPTVQAADLTSGFKKGTVELSSSGPLAFGPDGVLFVGDTKAAAIYAVATGDTHGDPEATSINIDKVNEKIAAMLGVEAQGMIVNDMAVNPASGNLYMSVSRDRSVGATPVILKIANGGKISVMDLEGIRYDHVSFANAPAPGGEGRRNRRAQSITDLEFVEGRLLVAGLSNEEFASTLRSLPVPFGDSAGGTSVEIFHGAHGRFETASPVRTFTSYMIEDQAHLLCAYTCTPLVKLPVSALKPGTKVMGSTIAELGNRNQPLDMFVYKKDGKDYILMANSSRGVMKITTENINKIESIKERVGGGGTAGLTYETLTDMKGVTQLNRLNGNHAIALMQSETGEMTLKTIPLP